MKKILFLVIIILSLILFVVAQEKGLSPAFSSMVSTERAFARMAGLHGVRNSFITFFADDGINFTPNPVKTRENLMSTPPPATPPPIVLNWTPIYGDIAASEDLGYNTGPFLVEDKSPEKRPTRHGMFFSVWRRQSDKSWKVVLDMGASTPSAAAPLDAPFVAAPVAKVKSRDVSASEGHEEILRIDRDFLLSALNKPLGEALKDSLQETARLYVTGSMPLIGRKAIVTGGIDDKRLVTGEPVDGAMSRSGDLAYVYGRYELKGASGSEKGYYSRVWRIDARGKWHIAVCVMNPLPAN